MKKLILLLIVATALVAAASASATTAASATPAGKPLPCSRYVPQMGVNAISNPPTWKCAKSIYSRWLQCLINTYDRNGVFNALTCYKLRTATRYTLVYAVGVSRRVKRNTLIDFQGSLENYCSADDPSICNEVEDVEREIRKLS